MSKRLERSEAAQYDELDVLNWYADTAGEEIAYNFLDSLRATYRLIASEPQLGSRYYAQILPGIQVQTSSVKPYPYLVFYVEMTDAVRVGRILHTRRHKDVQLRPHNF